ncbi:MAG: TonB-dependent receptor [Bacteroidetes bacterium]|nr:TonB-dependent receptor [Bacteroidota bacterium]
MQKFILLVLFVVGNYSLQAKGKITGKVVDENNQPLIGATVMITGTTSGAKTDLNGDYSIANLEFKTYELSFAYISYDKKLVSDIVVSSTEPVFVNVALVPAKKGLNNVVVKSSMKKESLNALLVQQKNMTTISDGISAEMIRKSPDKNSSEVLKRVSGVSISEGKFAIIRGLSDRYNMAMLNGSLLPSSEADRRAFSFDMFPSNFLDNITIIKAATPEYPAEFAGGIVELNTKDIPTENYLNIQIGSGYNSISTFKKYYDGQNGNTDWLGLDNKSRSLPSNFPSTEKFNSSTNDFTKQERFDASKTLKNNWGTTLHNSMLPNRIIQVTGAWHKDMKNKSSIGLIGAISYNRSQRFNSIQRKEFELDQTFIYDYTDSAYRDNVLAGAMLNIGYKINSKNKITLRTNYNINSEDQTIRRSGIQVVNEQYLRNTALWFSSNTMLTTQLAGDHSFSKHKIKLSWNGTMNEINRNTPDLKKTYYIKSYTNPDDTMYRAYVPMQASPNYSGRFYSTLNEKVYSGKVDIGMPFKILKVAQQVKTGVYILSKERNFSSRELGYVIANPAQFNQSLNLLSDDKIFASENMNNAGFMIADITQGTNSYNANSSMQAAYLQFDNKFLKNFRVVWGLRYENYKATLNSQTNIPIEVGNNFSNVLPSFNLTYQLQKKTNIRLYASKTLSRPEFRELAPFPFFDFNTSSVLVGNTALVQTEIKNLDLKYEYFPGKGEIVSASLFYKHFDNPIEAVLDASSTAGTRSFTYGNAPTADNYGIELDFRKSLSFINQSEKSIWSNLSVFGNLSLIQSKINVKQQTVFGDTTFTRPLQGQSPYVINMGLNASIPGINCNLTLLYNRIGERIVLVGNTYVPDLYEKSRNVIDFQITKKIGKGAEVKLNLGDLLHNPFIFYQNGINDKKKTYSSKTDAVVTSVSQGFNCGLSFAYKF